MRCVDYDGDGNPLIRHSGTAIGNLAVSYRALGRLADVLAMREQLLESQRRVLPENHPVIGEGCVGSDAFACVLLIAKT
jgi:hypothetical protein